MKIICVDNHAREHVADRLVAENIKSVFEAELMVRALNERRSRSDWFALRSDDYKLCRGVEGV